MTEWSTETTTWPPWPLAAIRGRSMQLTTRVTLAREQRLSGQQADPHRDRSVSACCPVAAAANAAAASAKA